MHLIFELQETEYWDDEWHPVGFYVTRELAEQARDRRAAMLRSEFDDSVGKFEDWYTWNIHPRPLSGNPSLLEHHRPKLPE